MLCRADLRKCILIHAHTKTHLTLIHSLRHFDTETLAPTHVHIRRFYQLSLLISISSYHILVTIMQCCVFSYLKYFFILNHWHYPSHLIRYFNFNFNTALKIDMGDDVATANNKMEFLLDKAEARLRDTALCGW